MDELTQHRKKRLEQVIAGAPYHGDRSVFLKAVDITKGRLSQMLGSEAAFGELSARRMAQKLDLDERYFESGAPGQRHVWPFTLVTPEQIQQLHPKALDMVQKFTLDLLESQSLLIVSPSTKSNTEGKRSIKAGFHKLEATRINIDKRASDFEEKPRQSRRNRDG